MMNRIPAMQWTRGYRSEWFMGDLMAGLTVGIMLIPQGMAYAMLAGLPPIYGLYTAIVPLFVYAFFGTSWRLSVGPAAIISLLTASALQGAALPESVEYIQLAILLAALVGIIQLALGLMRLGFIVNFLAEPVIRGFTVAAVIIISLSQLGHILGVGGVGGHVFSSLEQLWSLRDAVHWPTFAIGLVSMFLLWGLKRLSPKLPAAIVVVVLGIAVVHFFGLQDVGVATVGEVPSGLDILSLPSIDIMGIERLWPFALTIAFVGILQSVAVAKAVQRQDDVVSLDPGKEMVALGAANLIGSFASAFPVAGGLGRTAVNTRSGATTPLSSIFSSLVVILVLLLLTGLFYSLPIAVLGAIIIVAVSGLLDIPAARQLWNTDKRDFLLFAGTAAATLLFGVTTGILSGVMLSILMLVYRVSYPHIATLARVPGTQEFRNVERFDGLEHTDGVHVFRFDAELFFANAGHFRDHIHGVLEKDEAIKQVIFDASALNHLDSSALQMLRKLSKNCQDQGVELHFSAVRGPVRDALGRSGLAEQWGASRFHLSLHAALRSIEDGNRKVDEHWVMQTD